MGTETTPPAAALAFGSDVDAYDRGRPGFPLEAAEWLTGLGERQGPLSVLELGAGTGKLTEQLLALGHDVHATDPDARMLGRLTEKFPELRVSQTTAEEIPAPDACFDVVVAAESYEWFDHERALPEIARVLKRGGWLALAWNIRDERIPWVKRLGNLVGHHTTGQGAGDELEDSPYFGPAEEAAFKQWQTIHRESVQDLVRSMGSVCGLEPHAQEAKVREVLDFYDDFGRGMDGMQLPWVTECFRAVVGIRPHAARPHVSSTSEGGDGSGDRASDGAVDSAEPEETQPFDPMAESEPADDDVDLPAAAEPPVVDDDTGMLLIDFR